MERIATAPRLVGNTPCDKKNARLEIPYIAHGVCIAMGAGRADLLLS
jgi:hypothetical protein